ncbi:MAG: hypothetical protein IRZ33_02975 [Alicyclobacillaceae bacterium]|nr:hypothetical protein [Alicyclobacillaceae bacterium]
MAESQRSGQGHVQVGGQEHGGSAKDVVWPQLPRALQHRLSQRWATFEALRILQQRWARQGKSGHVVLLTPLGFIEGELVDIADSYEASLDAGDPISATVHLRTDIWRMYEQVDERLEPADAGAVVCLRGATVRMGGRRLRLDHLALFADDVLGFTLSARPPL